VGAVGRMPASAWVLILGFLCERRGDEVVFMSLVLGGSPTDDLPEAWCVSKEIKIYF